MDPDIELMYVAPGDQGIPRDKLKVVLSEKFNRKTLPGPHEGNIDKIWQLRVKMNPKLYNGTKFRIDSATQNEETGEVTFNLGITDYKDFIGTNWSPDAKHYRKFGQRDFGNLQAYMSDALGVGAMVVTSDERVVLLRRSQYCGEAMGMLDIPGGHAEPQELVGKIEASEVDLTSLSPDDVVDEIFFSTLREIVDEVNIPLTSLTDPVLLGIARNTTSAGRPSSEYLVHCSLTSDEVKKLYQEGTHAEADESTGLRTLSISEVLTLQDKTDIWKDLAPSAKGCITLYQKMMDKKNG